MNWWAIFSVAAPCLNLVSMGMNFYSTKKAKLEYRDKSDYAAGRMNDMYIDFEFHKNQLIEEINLLKTNEGLYSSRENEDQYQMYLALLRKGSYKEQQ